MRKLVINEQLHNTQYKYIYLNSTKDHRINYYQVSGLYVEFIIRTRFCCTVNCTHSPKMILSCRRQTFQRRAVIVGRVHPDRVAPPPKNPYMTIGRIL